MSLEYRHIMVTKGGSWTRIVGMNNKRGLMHQVNNKMSTPVRICNEQVVHHIFGGGQLMGR